MKLENSGEGGVLWQEAKSVFSGFQVDLLGLVDNSIFLCSTSTTTGKRRFIWWKTKTGFCPNWGTGVGAGMGLCPSWKKPLGRRTAGQVSSR